MIAITITPVADLASAEQHFRCIPYSATIAARVCRLRQRQHGAAVMMSGKGKNQIAEHEPGGPGRPAFRRIENGQCGDCELGRSVLAQLRRVKA